jgi:radical SAM protein with 4Fe4S-binding SPASM domain
MSGMPPGLDIEVTNRCNMNCVMCPREGLNASPMDMSLEFFKRIVDQAESYLEYICFSSRGESLLNGQVFGMIDHAKKAGIYTSMPTNGMLLNEQNGRALLDSGLDLLTVSIDATTPETYDRIRRGGDFRHVVENTERMVGLNRERKNPMTIVVQMVRLAENDPEIKGFKATWRNQRHVLAKTKPFSSRAGLVDNRSLSSRKGRRVCCSRIWKSLSLYADGTAVPCCDDFLCRYPLGNVNSNSIGEIWSGGPLTDLRRRHGAGEFEAIPMCRHCEFPRINFGKQVATFICDDLAVRKMLAFFALTY